MRKYIISFCISAFVYVLILSLGHSYYLTQINNQMEVTITQLVEKIAELQRQNASRIELNKGGLK